MQPIYNGYGGPRLSAEQVRKSFILHATGTGNNESGNPFTLAPAQATAVVGGQRLDLRTLLPQSPSYRVIQEGGDVGQFRLEYDVSGSAQSYLLNVVSLRDASDAVVNATLQDLGDRWQIDLSHPVKGNASVTLQKGATSSGGNVRIDGANAIPLRSDIQPMQIGDNGPVWIKGPMFTGGRLPALRTTTAVTAATAATSRGVSASVSSKPNETMTTTRTPVRERR
jgi:hypothetical protein